MFRWWKEVPPEDQDAFEDRCLHLDSNPVVLQSWVDKPELLAEAFVEERGDAEVLQRLFGGEIEPFETRDWVEQSLLPAHRQHLLFGERLAVSLDDSAEFLAELALLEPEREILCIPPVLAFGTGDHETTATCLGWIDALSRERAGTEWTVLDLGTGTGILALAALRLGAARALGIENDPLALAAARVNRERHGLEPDRFVLDEADVLDWEPDGPVDLVAANLFSDMLLALLPKFPGWLKPGGVLMLSGIMASQVEAVLDGLAKLPLEVEEQVLKGKWVSLRVRPAL